MGFGDEGSGEILGCRCDNFRWSGRWHVAMVREPADGLGDASAIGGGQPDVVTPIVVHGWPDVETIGGMRGPGRAVLWSRVCK